MSKREDENNLVTFSKSLAVHDASTIRVFQRSDSEWTCLGVDAEAVAQIVYRTASALRKIGNAQIPMCSMNITLFRNFLIDALQKRGLRIEIYEQESGSRLRWKQNPVKASPGNLQAVEDLISQGTDQSPVIVAVKASTGSINGEKMVGVCFVDAEARRLGLSQFADNDLFSNMESLIIQLGAKEVLITDDKSPETKRIESMLDRLDILVTRRKPSEFNARDVEQDLEKLTGKPSLELQRELQLSSALSAASAAIKYLGLMVSKSNFNNFSLEEHDLQQYMRLDASALRALNVMPSVRDGSKTMSLFGLLNQCKTTSGSRLLAQWLKQPLMNVDEIKKRHDLVEEFVNDPILRSKFQDDLLLVVPDLGKLQRKFHTQNAKLEDVVNIYHLVSRLPDFVTELSSAPILREMYGLALESAQNELGKLVELVEQTVDLVALERHEYVVRADFSEDLVELKQRRAAAYDEMEVELERVNAELETDKVKLEDNPNMGWAFRLTRTDAGILRGRKGFIDLKTQKAGQFFTTKRLSELASQHQALGDEYRRAQSSVAKEVVNVASTYLPVLGPLGTTLSHLDVILSFAHVSAFAKLPYVRPTFGDRISLKQARHPSMEVQADMMFIPNDVELVPGESEFAIITGPNMGGKSTYIRQIGVIAHLAQIGCFVPCDEAQLSIVDCILARVGAGDSQLKGISTFMAEMLETAAILKTATPRSLIVIDELGRGTSTYDGFGLAWAISQHIVQHIGCFCLFATHFHELTALADKNKGVKNLHVVANADGSDDDITLLYKVEEGVSERSFGIHVAEVVHFPDKVVRMAKRKAEELEQLDSASALDPADVEKGTQLLRTTLHDWAKETSGIEDRESAVKRLRSVIESNRAAFEANPFLNQILTTL